MQKLVTYNDLAKAYAKYKPLVALREQARTERSPKRELLVCGDTGCQPTNGPEVLAALQREIKAAGLQDSVAAHLTGCFGFCEQGPIVKVFPDDVFYVRVSPEDAKSIVKEHLIGNTPVKRLLFADPARKGARIARQDELPFYKKQLRIVLHNCGFINPELLEEYIATGGYQALSDCLRDKKPGEVVEEVKASGLRGRGGGGFSAGVKWEMAAKQRDGQKYIVCNADEGDPGAFMDRSILEGDPHCVLEGMAIAAYAIGASLGYIYIRAEYPQAIKRLQGALDQAYKAGLLGKNILSSGFNFDLELRYGAGAFVCGEETALIRSIEGGRGEPVTKPPFPAEKGLYGQPTIINNVETLANVPQILRRGAAWFASIGSERSKGTKVFALAGKINNVGLVEVPMGTKLRDIIYEIGGGIKKGKKFKAVQTGGPSGGCLPAAYLDTLIDYDSLSEKGSMMGSGGMIVMDEDNCMVDIAKFYIDFCAEESCGKCSPCRIGTKRIHELLTKIADGTACMEDLDKLRELSAVIKDTALCGLGQTAPNPVLSTLNHFYDEYVAHVRDKKCPAGVCVNLLDFYITDKCAGCSLCAKNCPVSCISGNKRKQHSIDNTRCIKCGVCQSACPVKAIVRQ